MEKQILNVREAAEFLGLKVPTLYKYTHGRNIPFIKLGSRVLFKSDELNRWIDEHKVKPIGGMR